MTKTISITQPDDWHIHLRNGNALKTTVAHAAKQFARAIVMPNLVPPVTTVDQAENYRHQILDNVPQGLNFEPLMTLYLTDNMSPDTIYQAKDAGFIHACKFYPAGATTHSDSGVTRLSNIFKTLEAMQTAGMPLLLHGEVTDPHVDIFDREKVFIDNSLTMLMKEFPELKIVLEHITTQYAVDFIKAQSHPIAATITAHHLLFDRNDLLVGGIKPHLYCLPILKKTDDRIALIKAATSGDPKFFLGTDSAPHAQTKKESACGCAGIYTAHIAMECYAQVFEQENALNQLEGFASFYGPDFYGLERNTKKITLVKTPQAIPNAYSFDVGQLIPLFAGQSIHWSLAKG